MYKMAQILNSLQKNRKKKIRENIGDKEKDREKHGKILGLEK